jgi:hypothetical protein
MSVCHYDQEGYALLAEHRCNVEPGAIQQLQVQDHTVGALRGHCMHGIEDTEARPIDQIALVG